MSNFEYLQGLTFHNLSGQFMPMLDNPHCDLFSTYTLETSLHYSSLSCFCCAPPRKDTNKMSFTFSPSD